MTATPGLLSALFGARRAGSGTIVGSEENMHTTSVTPSTHSQLPAASAEAVVDLGAIARNVRVLREHAGPAQVMVVVKADAYGHGATQVARAALAAGAAELGVATIDEALSLRRDGITAPVLAWLHPPGTDFAPALTAGVQIGVSSVRQVEELLDAVDRTGRTAELTIKVDTGLNRNGVSAAEYPAVLDAVLRATAGEAIRVRGIMSHLANGDLPEDPLNDLQAKRFTEMLAEARMGLELFPVRQVHGLGADVVDGRQFACGRRDAAETARARRGSHVDRRPAATALARRSPPRRVRLQRNAHGARARRARRRRDRTPTARPAPRSARTGSASPLR